MNLKNTIIGLIILILQINSAITVENKILFKVENEIITSLDIFNELRYLETINEQFKNTEKKQAFEIAKKSLIREKIKEIELKKIIKTIMLEERYLNSVIINYFKQLEIKSISDFEKYFNSIDIDPELIKQKITIEVLWNDLIYSKYNQRVKIDKKAVVKNLKKSDKQMEYLLSEIVFNTNENEKLEEKYNLIQNKIQKTNFSETALTYSISDTANKGGKLDWIKETAVSKKILDILQNIDVGNHSEPIVIPGGFLILKINEVREVNIDLNLEEEIESVIRKKTNEQLNQFSNMYFNKIQKNTNINEL